LRQYAKHRGCSPAAVSKAVRDQRLVESVAVQNGRPRILSFLKADEEWRHNTDSTKAPARVREDASSGAGIPVFPADRFTVFTHRSLVIFGALKGADLDLDRDNAWPMSAATARELAAKLLEAAADHV